MRAEGLYGSMHTTFSTYGIHFTMEPLTIGTKDFGHYRGMATNQGFYKDYFNAVGTKVSGHEREGGRSSGVAIKRGSTVLQNSANFHHPLF